MLRLADVSYGRVHTKLTKQKLCVLRQICNNSATCWCFLQLCRVASPVGRSKVFCFVASFVTCRLVSAYCGSFAVCRGHEFNTSKVEYGRDVSINIVHLLSADRTQKPLLFFFLFHIFYAAVRSHLHFP